MYKIMEEKKHKNISSYPVWLYMVYSLTIPIYGLFYFIMTKDKHPKRAKISLVFTLIGIVLWLTILKLIWLS